MKRNRRHPRNMKKQALSELVEKEVLPQSADELNFESDSLDSDLGIYIQSFLHDFMNNKPLPATNLLTPESAQQALQIITRTQEEISRQLKTARALKGLLEQKQRP